MVRRVDFCQPQVVCPTAFNALMLDSNDLVSESKWALNVRLRSKITPSILGVGLTRRMLSLMVMEGAHLLSFDHVEKGDTSHLSVFS